MARYPKMIYKKDNPSQLKIVSKTKYYKRIHEGWGLVSAAKFGRRCQMLLDRMDMTFNQFWERIQRTFDDPVRSKRWFREAMSGRIEDSQLDFLLLHVVATAACQPISYFTQEKDLVPVWPWKYWALDEAAERARTVSWFQIHWKVDDQEGIKAISAHDEVQARGIWMEKYPHSEIIRVIEAPAEIGTEIG